MILLATAALAAQLDATGPVTWNELQPTAIDANTWLKSNWNKFEENYHPNYAFDDDPATAWVEGLGGNGEGAVLKWRVSPLASARAVRLVIRNGYHKSTKLLEANAAPSTVVVSVGKASVTVPLARKMGWQEVVVPIPEGQRVEDMSLRVQAATPGKVYADSCVSDIKVYVDSDVPYNAAVEASKREDLLTWKKARVDEAKAFAALPVDYPWAGTSFTQVEEHQEVPYAEATAAMAEARGRLLHLMSTDIPWKRLSPVKTWTAPEGAHVDAKLVLRLGDVAWFEANGEVAAKGEGYEEPRDSAYNPQKAWWRSNHRVREVYAGGEPAGTYVYAWERRIVEERGTYDTTTRRVSFYDTAGRLAWQYEHASYGSENLTRYVWSPAGKVVRLERLWATDGQFADFEDESYASRSVLAAR